MSHHGLDGMGYYPAGVRYRAPMHYAKVVKTGFEVVNFDK